MLVRHIISQWPGNALRLSRETKLPADQWVHVAVTYDGSKKAAGVHVYVNGKSQPTNVLADTLTETIRTTVPFKIGQRNKTSPLSGASIQDVRMYARRLADGDVASLARSALSAVVAAPPEKRRPEEIEVSTTGGSPVSTTSIRHSQTARALTARAGRHSGPQHDLAT